MARKTEVVVRCCPHTGKLVLAEVFIDNEEENIVCLHNELEDDDREDVLDWLKEHGL